MANLPARTNKSSVLESQARFKELIAEQIALGKRPHQIARQIYPDNRSKRAVLSRRIWTMASDDGEFHAMVARRARAEMLFGLGPATKALAGRAGRGRVDAIKLLFEASGFHNTHIKHDHSGEIKVKLDIPRPTFDADVADAEVVE